MNEKTLDNESVEQAKQNVSDIKVFGDGDTFTLLCKASSESQGWMKSTKVANVDGGCIVQVTTQQKNQDGSYAVAEAVTYVPNNHIDITTYPRRLVRIDWPVKNSLAGYSPTPEDVERNEKNEINYNRREYLGILLELQKSGHNVHDEINESLKTLKESYGI